MSNPSTKWDLVPIFGVWMKADESPVSGTVKFEMSSRITRVDGRIIYPVGALASFVIGAMDQQDSATMAQVRDAWRAADQAALGGSFDGTAWDTWWTTKVLPAAIFASFRAADDPDIVQHDWTVKVTESFLGGRSYNIQPLLTTLTLPIPGINLGLIEDPTSSSGTIAPVYAKGTPGGVAGLDSLGRVLDASGNPISGSVYILNADQTAADIPGTLAAGTLIVRKLS